VLLEDLSQPGRAAAAFRRAYELAPRGALAENSLRREIESLKKAGKNAEAELKMDEYTRQFPGAGR
jgi:hypothetical protein